MTPLEFFLPPNPNDETGAKPIRKYKGPMKEFNDDTPMPFGKHKGEPLQDVPASYLHWIWIQRDFDKASPLGKYIEKNLSNLKQEYSNGIWD